MEKVFNPCNISTTLDDEFYNFLKTQFQLCDFNFNLVNNPTFSRRNLVLGHNNFDKWLRAAEDGKKVALVSGFMASGNFHVGSLAVLKQMCYYQQKYDAKIFISIADLEAICVRKTRREDVNKIVIQFLAHFYAVGLDVNKCNIYLQTQNLDVLRHAAILTSDISLDNIEKIYDKKMTLGEVFSSLIMVADILYPQNLSYAETLITLGIDGISHFILTKELVKKLGYDIPTITYNKMITDLRGSKIMGKSMPENGILLTDTPEIIENKLNSLRDKNFSLIRNSAFNILQWYCEDDFIIEEIIKEKNPKIANDLAIDNAIKVIKPFLIQHQKKYKENLKNAEKMVSTLKKGGLK